MIHLHFCFDIYKNYTDSNYIESTFVNINKIGNLLVISYKNIKSEFGFLNNNELMYRQLNAHYTN
jgi:hypothetical protein